MVIFKNLELLIRTYYWNLDRQLFPPGKTKSKIRDGINAVDLDKYLATSETIKDLIRDGIDAVCFREVPLGELKCKHEDVPKKWLNGRGTSEAVRRVQRLAGDSDDE
jgi:hypothetical protein